MREINSFKDFMNITDEIHHRAFYNDYREHYRGLSSITHELLPTISRKLKTGSNVKEVDYLLYNSFIAKVKANELAILQIENLQTTFEHFEKWNTLFQARHYEVKSRLVDWSASRFVSLWFAVREEKYFNEDGIFWVFKVPHEQFISDENKKELLKIDPFQLEKNYFINFPYVWDDQYTNYTPEDRRRTQYGRFFIQPYDKINIPLNEQPEISSYFEKFIINKNSKQALKVELSKQVNDYSLHIQADLELNSKINSINASVNCFYF